MYLCNVWLCREVRSASVNPAAMRKQILGQILVLWSIVFAPVTGRAQTDCGEWFSQIANTTLVYGHYDIEGELTSYSRRLVREVDSRGPAQSLALVDLAAWQPSGDTLFSGTYVQACQNGYLLAGVLSRLTPDMLKPIAGLEVAVEGTALVIPTDLDSLTSLSPVRARLSVLENGTPYVNLDLAFASIAVRGREALTTPAGTYPCTLLEYDMIVTMLVPKRFHCKEWYHPQFGILRREVFDQHRRFVSYQELLRVEGR